MTNTSVVQCFERRLRLREQPGLDLLCNFEFLGDAAFSLQLLRSRPALCLDFSDEVVPPDERKRVSIQVVEASENPAPKCGLWWMMKEDPTLAPLVELGDYILGN